MTTQSQGVGSPTPGWYPQGTVNRYWDGQQWTEHTAPLAPPDDPPAVPMSGQSPMPGAPHDRRGKPIYLRWWFLAGAAVLLIGIVGAALSSAGEGDPATNTSDGGSTPRAGASAASASKPATKPAAKQTKAPAKQVPGVGTAVRDGKFQFAVTKVVKGKARVGDDILGKQAQGQFVLVYVTVKNIGDEPQTLFGENQTLYDTKGRKFSADTEAAIYVDQSKTLIEEINPGNQLSGIIIFDVPKDAVPTKIELHDSAFSGGVTVTLQ
jgi:Domain of unknown function (DUF4352)/Protein of unknown function (DUF2510)